MSSALRRTINADIRDSVPDWTPFEPPQAPFFLTPVRASGTSGVATGLLSLYHGDRKAGEGRVKNQPGYHELAGEGLCLGRDSGVAVIDMEAPGRHH